MRLTVRINENTSAPRQAFAVLWLDTDRRLWSREAHQGIDDLPPWGTLEILGGEIALHGAGSERTLCRLQGLSFSDLSPGHEHGMAEVGLGRVRGAWRVQAIDASQAAPERSDFPCIHS